MSEDTKFFAPNPIVNEKESSSLDDLSKCYNKLIEPSIIEV